MKSKSKKINVPFVPLTKQRKEIEKNDWRITSTRKPSKKFISYLKMVAKADKDIDIASIGKGKKPLKEIVNIKYRSLLNDIKSYSKDDYYYITGYTDVYDLALKMSKMIKLDKEIKKIEREKKKTKTVKPKTKTKTVKKKSKITKKSLYDEDTYKLKSESKDSKIKDGYRPYLAGSMIVTDMKEVKRIIKEELKPKGYKTKIYKRTNFPKPDISNYWMKVLVKNGKIVKK
jgi:hypothetical protein